jgi:hypothetical protein
MSLAIVLESLPPTVRRDEATFQRARASEPAFGPYTTATALLEALSTRFALATGERQSLVAAVLRLHRATRQPLWQALLLRAFEPLLLGLRARYRGCKEERDQRILVAFLHVVDRVRVDARPLFVAVARATARALFGAVRAEEGQIETVAYEETINECAPAPHTEPGPYVACLAREVITRLSAREGGEDVVRVLAGVETGGDQVRRLALPDAAPAREAKQAAARLRQRRRRALEEMRALFAGDSSQELA